MNGRPSAHIRPTKAEDAITKLNRNDLCHCGSGKKYKKCHLAADDAARAAELAAKNAAAAAAVAAEAERDPDAAAKKEQSVKEGTQRSPASHTKNVPAMSSPSAKQARRRGVT